MEAQSKKGTAYILSIANVAFERARKHRTMTTAVAVASAAVAIVAPYLFASSPNTLHSSPASQTTGGPVEPVQNNPGIEQQNSSDGQGSTASGLQNQTSVTVNSQKVETPTNTEYSKTIDDGASRTTIHVESRNSSTGSSTSIQSSSSSSIQTQLRSETTTTTSSSD